MTDIHLSQNRERDQALASDLTLLKDTVSAAGEIALRYFGASPDVSIKADGSEVSVADIEVNNFLRKELLSARPNYGWLSEESEAKPAPGLSKPVWIIDPIDGTRGFLREKSDWTIAVGLIKNSAPVAGAIFAPARDEFYLAGLGYGATLNDEAITVSKKSDIEGAELVAGKAIYKSERWETPWPNVNLSWSNSMAYRICLVAKGVADATISLNNKSDWDLAGAHAILNEAGGRLTVKDGQEPKYNIPDYLHDNVVAASHAMSTTLLKRLRPSS